MVVGAHFIAPRTSLHSQVGAFHSMAAGLKNHIWTVKELLTTLLVPLASANPPKVIGNVVY
jgi:hypothetical protein